MYIFDYLNYNLNISEYVLQQFLRKQSQIAKIVSILPSQITFLRLLESISMSGLIKKH